MAEVPAGSNLLQSALAVGVKIESTCGGKGTCGKCKVQVSSGNLLPNTSIEKEFLSEAELGAGWVLACQQQLFEDTAVISKEQKDVFKRKLGFEETIAVDSPASGINKSVLSLSPPSTEDQLPDWERLLSALGHTKTPFNRSVAAYLPKVLREGKFQVTAVLDEEEALLAVEVGDTSSRLYGLAIDIGTTTIVVYLMDLNTGLVLASGAATNPQNVFGADVISRIVHVTDSDDGLQQLQEKLINGLNDVISGLCHHVGISHNEIYRAVAVGNTTMSHLFLGIDPTYLAPAPFVPVFRRAVQVEAGELRLNMLNTGKVSVLPNVSGYVGSDTVGVMLAAGVDRLQGINLIIDIGTNGEVILVGKGRILTCSTAAGPAFEGAEIKSGMRAAEGAIEGVTISDDVQLKVIGETKPRGICGSGLIDAVSEMYKAGIIDASGRLAKKDQSCDRLPDNLRRRLRENDGGQEFVLVWGSHSDNGEDIVLSQKDIRELQLAKGAIMAGASILLGDMGVSPQEIDRVLLAGAFGNYINRESAREIGLLPSLPLECIEAIGNAAGHGAKMALLSSEERVRADTLSRRAKHVELSVRVEFQKEFVESLSFGRKV